LIIELDIDDVVYKVHIDFSHMCQAALEGIGWYGQRRDDDLAGDAEPSRTLKDSLLPFDSKILDNMKMYRYILMLFMVLRCSWSNFEHASSYGCPQ